MMKEGDNVRRSSVQKGQTLVCAGGSFDDMDQNPSHHPLQRHWLGPLSPPFPDTSGGCDVLNWNLNTLPRWLVCVCVLHFILTGNENRKKNSSLSILHKG